jgi:hypothetical protein
VEAVVDPAELASTVLPYVSAVAGAYGGAVLDRVRDQATDAGADATVSLGRRVLRRLLGREASSVAIEGAVLDLAGDPADEDFQAAVRAQINKALREDEQLRADLAALLTNAGASTGSTVAVTGSQGVQVGDHNTQTNTFGAGSS